MFSFPATRRELLATAMMAAGPQDPDPPPTLGEPGPPEVLADGVAVSQDGRLIAFTFGRPVKAGGGQAWWTGIGLLETGTGRLHRIPNPPGRRLSVQNLDPTGTQLVCLSGVAGQSARGIAYVELVTGQVREVFGPASPVPALPIYYVSDAAVQPGTGRLLISRRASEFRPHELLLLDPTRRELTPLLPYNESSELIEDIRFLSQDEILFQAAGPASRGRLREQYNTLGVLSPLLILCRMRFGELPQLLVPELQRAASSQQSEFRSLALARDGTLYSTSRRGRPGPGFANQLCRIDIGAGQMEYLTATPGLKQSVAVAADGSLIAFLASDEVDPRSPYELWTLDRRGSGLRRQDLLPRLRGDRRFFLP